MSESPRALIESLGVYLPPKSVTTKEIIAGCAHKVLLPLERMTGIESRRMAGDDEFSFDLAVKAVEECLALSKYSAADIDLVISCNISRFDGPSRYSFEPSTASRLRTAFGIHHALAFDVTNACAGMFTGIYLAETLIRAGTVRRGLVVSGEYITHVTDTAQKEISGFTDPLLACLTLGDAGAAVLLDSTVNGSEKSAAGLHALELYTIGRHSNLCIAKITQEPHGGAIMSTDMIAMARVAVTAFLQHAALTVFRLGWAAGDIQHVIPHQTSKTTLDAGTRSIQRAVAKRGIDFDKKLVVNVAERGNTATTSHFVALKDFIVNGKINSGDSIVFGVLASGITVGTAVYRLDDLPDRVRFHQNNKQLDSVDSPRQTEPDRRFYTTSDTSPRVCIEALGFADEASPRETLSMLTEASTRCIDSSSYNNGDINLVLYTGVYRSEYLSEPAVASLLAGELRINDAPKTVMERRSLAFDIINGGLGFLDACYTATTLIRERKAKAVLVTTAEVENNASLFPGQLRGIHETGAAAILNATADGDIGFGSFAFRSFPEYATSLSAYCATRVRQEGDRYVPQLIVEQDSEIEQQYAHCSATAAEEFLEKLGLNTDDIAVFLPPQISPAFIDKFAELLGIERGRCVDATIPNVDLFTATLPYCLQQIETNNNHTRGDIGLIINIAAGIEVGCATYHF